MWPGNLLLARIYPLDGDQNLSRKQRTCGATVSQTLQVVPRDLARAVPSTRDRYWLATVKNELPLTSSQRSNPVWFLMPSGERLDAGIQIGLPTSIGRRSSDRSVLLARGFWTRLTCSRYLVTSWSRQSSRLLEGPAHLAAVFLILGSANHLRHQQKRNATYPSCRCTE